MAPLIIFISVCAVIVLILVFVIVSKIIKKKRTNFVQSTSPYIAKIKSVNAQFENLQKSKSPALTYHYEFNSKRKFDSFYGDKAIKTVFADNRTEIRMTIENNVRRQSIYKEYQNDISKIEPTVFSDLPKSKLIKEKKYHEIEGRLANNVIIKRLPDTMMSISWSYTTPAGRYHYEDKTILTYRQIINEYKNYYGLDLTKVEENDRLDAILKSVKNYLTKPTYSEDQIIAFIKGHNVEPSNTAITLITQNAGLVKNEKFGLYVRNGINSIRDLILCSADETGLIHYNNFIKSTDYDEAITSLQEERKIVEISNLEFLKISENLSYEGLSMEDIDAFDKLVFDYAQTSPYFSVKTIGENIESRVTDVSFSKRLILSLLKSNRRLREVAGLPGLFTIKGSKERIKFLIHLMGQNKSVNAYDLLQAVADTFDIEYPIASIKYDISKGSSKLYYNDETGKIYSNKDVFYEEIL